MRTNIISRSRLSRHTSIALLMLLGLALPLTTSNAIRSTQQSQSSELFNIRGAPDEVWNRYQNIRRVGSMPTCADEDNLYLQVKADLAEWMRNFKQFIHEEKKACGRDTRCGTRYNQMWSDAVRKSMETIRKINEEHGYRQQNCIESRQD
jgi:hypothetical protein